MKNVKMFGMIVMFTITSSLVASAQEKPKTAKLKKHVCTEACHKAGKCVFAHGEKGHVCDANCKKM